MAVHPMHHRKSLSVSVRSAIATTVLTVTCCSAAVALVTAACSLVCSVQALARVSLHVLVVCIGSIGEPHRSFFCRNPFSPMQISALSILVPQLVLLLASRIELLRCMLGSRFCIQRWQRTLHPKPEARHRKP